LFQVEAIDFKATDFSLRAQSTRIRGKQNNLEFGLDKTTDLNLVAISQALAGTLADVAKRTK
jgi:hypothetical protein